jgi:mannose/cellobiose epimerase-like protein (N-acyl-D-glucosamine 2-epimerase family)
MSGSWTQLPAHRAWLDAEGQRLLDTAKAARIPGGFAWLDAEGAPDPQQPLQLWITARMTHVFSLAALRGVPGAASYADHGVAALLAGPLRDDVHDGWYPAVGEERKAMYDHAFVLIAASSAAVAGRPGADRLLQEAITLVERYFWDDVQGWSREAYDRAWTEAEPYLGANSNMHSVEAFLSVADALDEDKWRDRALRIAGFFIEHVSRRHDWRIPEHFDPDGGVALEFNAENKADKFRPYGTTPGHALEWARLLLHLRAGLTDPPAWLEEAARGLFDGAVAAGWDVDGAEGFVYTLDYDDKPVVRERMHWVVCEGINAAAVLARVTRDEKYEEWYRKLWDYADGHLIDREHGGWFHELDVKNRPAATVWPGKADTYHAYQATLIPQLPLTPMLSSALKNSLEATQ